MLVFFGKYIRLHRQRQIQTQTEVFIGFFFEKKFEAETDKDRGRHRQKTEKARMDTRVFFHARHMHSCQDMSTRMSPPKLNLTKHTYKGTPYALMSAYVNTFMRACYVSFSLLTL